MRIARLLKSTAALLLLLALALSSLPALAVSQSTSMASRGDRYLVSRQSLNLHRGPGTEYGIITSMPKGTALTYVGNTDGWWKVYTESGRLGYVDRQYLTQESTEKDGKYFVTASELRIRRSPKTSSGVLGTVKKGTIVTISQLNGDWGYLTAGAKVQGWVSLTYLSHMNDETASPSNKPKPSTLYEVVPAKLNVRASGSVYASHIDTLRRGTDVYITKTDGDWVQVVYKVNGTLKNGWVSFAYLTQK